MLTLSPVRTGPFPLSPAQERLWLLHQLDPDVAAYNVPAAIRIHGPLDLEATQRAIDEIVRRHDILRTNFEVHTDRPVQMIRAAEPVNLELVDLAALPASGREAALRQIGGDDAAAGFNLARDPLLRVKLVRLGPAEHVLFYTMHHIVSDGWSLGVLAREFAQCYVAAAAGQPSPLRKLPLQYADYATRQRRLLSGTALRKQIDYWRERLKAPPVLELPTDRPRPAVRRYRGATARTSLSATATEGLKQLSRREGATLFMALSAVVKVLLHRYTGQSDIAIGSPTANRMQDVEGLIGFFVNTLVLRTDLSGRPGFLELLRRERQVALGAYAHQEIPFERLVEELQPPRDLSRSVFFQVMVVVQDTPLQGVEIGGLNFEPLAFESKTSKFDLTFAFAEVRGGLQVAIEYDTDLFDADRIERMGGHLQMLVEAILQNPEGRIGELEILPAAEKRRLLVEFNDTAVAGELRTVTELFEAQAALRPDAPAVVEGERTLSYGELNARANRLAWRLRRQWSVGPEKRVGLLADRSLEMIIGLLAIFKAGGAYVPIDPAYPAERIRFILEDSAVNVVLTQSRHRQLVSARGDGVVDLEATDADGPTTNLEPLQQPAHLAYLIYTSGSTGKPKGVMVEHRSLTHYVAHALKAYAVHPGLESTVHTPLGFDLTVTSIFPPLLAGAKVVLLTDDLSSAVRRGDGRSWLLKLTPAHLQQLNAGLLPDEVKSANGVLVIGGEQLTAEHLAFWQRHAPHVRLINEYGPTETTVGCSIYEVDAAFSAAGAVPIGAPIQNIRMYVLDANGQPAPIGVTGELFIGGAGVGRGYWNRPQLTAERFVPDPFHAGQRLYRTGDLGRWRADGNLEFLGRTDDQVKVRGYRIELGEIEAGLMRIPGVSQAVVVLRDVAGEPQLCGYFAGGMPAEAVRAELEKHLPSYMVPAFLTRVDALPLTTNGKVDRSKLAQPEIPRDEYRAPRTELEWRLAALWQEVLGIDRVGIQDNFFRAGGHSLKAVQLVERIHRRLKVQLRFNEIFQAATVQAQALLIAARQGAQEPAIERLPDAESYALSDAQRRLWVLSQFEGGSAAYNVPAAFTLEGDLDPDALRRAIDGVVARHESLRTTFVLAGGEPRQRVFPEGKPILEQIDLSAELNPDDRAREVAEQEIRRPFDLEREMPARAKLIRLGDGKWLLLFTLHHIVTDQWSVGVLTREALTLYAALREGREENPLPPLSVQYRDYVAWQNRRLADGGAARSREYWHEKLAGELPVLDLPTDRLRPTLKRYRGALHSFRLGSGALPGLEKLGQAGEATLFMVLTALVKALLHRYTSQEDVIVGTPIAGRDHSQLADQIGLYLGTLVLRDAVKAEDSFVALLQRVRRTALEAYEHQHYPFDKLVDELSIARDTSRHPIFDVMVLLIQDWGQVKPAGIDMKPFKTEHFASKFDLTFAFAEVRGGLQVAIEYDTDLFDADRIERMGGHLQMLVEAILQNPEGRIGELEILPTAEKRRLLVEFNDTAVAGELRTVTELFEAQAALRPEAPAVVEGERTLSYGELNARANRLAWRLRRQWSVGPEKRVGLLADRSLEMIVGLLAIFKAGGAYVPIDREYPRDRIEHILDDARLQVLVTQAHLADALPAPGTETIFLEGGDESASTAESANPPACARPENIAYLIYTSGSTGKPKGVAVPHRVLGNLIRWQLKNSRARAGSRTAQFAALSFDVSLQEIFSTWCSGGTLVIVPEPVRYDPEQLRKLLVDAGVERLFLPFVALQQLAAVPAGGLPPLQINEINTAGEQLQITREIAGFFAALPGAVLHNHYGPSETHVVTDHVLSGSARDWPLLPPIGKAVENVAIYLLDPRQRLVPIGVTGELYVGGVALARGYLNRPELTAGRFVPDPFSARPGARLYRTGDLARYRADGTIEFLGRSDHQVKIRGFRIELEEVENALLRVPGVEAARVLPKGAGTGRFLCAYFTGAAELTAAGLRNELKKTLPRYMIPGHFIRLEQFPLNRNGKVALDALPEPQPGADGENYQPLEGDVELRLGRIWQEVLQLDGLGRTHDFFELGGNSLMAARIVNRINQEFGQELPLSAVFQHSQLGEFAAFLKEQRQQPPAAAARLEPQAGPPGPTPLTDAQQRIWWLCELAPEDPSYNVNFALHFQGRLDPQLAVDCLNRLIERHESLRTAFPIVGRLPAAQVQERLVLSPTWIELDGAHGPDARRQLKAAAMREFLVPFDVKKGPLIRLTLLRLSPEEFVMLVTIHHIITDGWSNQILSREFTQLLAHGESAGLAPMRYQYRDYARWQGKQLQGRRFEELKQFWTTRLTGMKPLSLARGRSPSGNFIKGRSFYFEIPGDLAVAVREVARWRGMTFFMVVLAAFKRLLHQWTGEADVAVAVPMANRLRPEFEGMVGMFVNTLILRTPVGDVDVETLLARVKQTCIQSFAHQEMPFDEIVRLLNPRRQTRANPLFNIIFQVLDTSAPPLQLEGVQVKPFLWDSAPAEAGSEPAVAPLDAGANMASKFEMVFALFESRDNTTVYGKVEYAAELFTAGEVQKFVAGFTDILRAFTEGPAPAQRGRPLEAGAVAAPMDAAG